MRSNHSTRDVGRIAAAVLMLVGTAACASRPSESPESVQATRVAGPGDGRRARMFEGITLSATQQASIDSIRAAFRSRMRTSEGGGDRAQRRQVMEEQRSAIRNVLTADQQRIFDANVERMRQERGQGRGRRPD